MRSVTVVVVAAITMAVLTSAQPRRGNNFVARLSSDEEVPPNDSRGTGMAHFKVVKDGVQYRVHVANIRNVVAAHVHLGAEGENGPIVAHLFGPIEAGGGAVNGKLAEGVIKAADLAGPLQGQALDRLIGELRREGVYVNVHTDDGVDPGATGPGDLPAGEIRGQIRAPSRPAAPAPAPK